MIFKLPSATDELARVKPIARVLAILADDRICDQAFRLFKFVEKIQDPEAMVLSINSRGSHVCVPTHPASGR